MLGPGRAGRQRRRVFSRRIGYVAPFVASLAVLALSASDCGFPDYGFGATSGAAGSFGAVGGAGTGGGGGTVTGGTSGSGGGGHPIGGEGGASAGAGGEAGAACVYTVSPGYAPHCFNKIKDPESETDVDCGGQCGPCAGAQTCSANADCSSQSCSANKCAPYLSMTYMSIVADAFAHTLKFNLELDYLQQNKFLRFQDLRIRYFFDHNGVNEPVIAPDTQGTYKSGTQQVELTSRHYRVYRTPRGPADERGIVTDSYLEITFDNAAQMTAGDSINLTQDIVAGADPTSTFQEATHYSFLQTGSSIPNPRIAIYEKDRLVWGMPPALAEIPDGAFAAGVSLNGPAVTVDGHELAAGSSANLTYSGQRFQNTASLVPVADAGTTTLLHTGLDLQSDVAAWTVPNGSYWAYAWLTSNVNAMSGVLMIQDNPSDRFDLQQLGSGNAWQKIGPYAVTVTDGRVKLNASGVVNIAGVELFRTAE